MDIINNPELLTELNINVSDDRIYYLYFLWYDNQIVYIGQTVNLAQRVIDHKTDKCFNKVTYNQYSCSYEDILRIELANIIHHKPIFNGECSKDKKRSLRTDEFFFNRVIGKVPMGELVRKDIKKGYFSTSTQGKPLWYYYSKSKDIYCFYDVENKGEIHKNFSLVETIPFMSGFNYTICIQNDELKVVSIQDKKQSSDKDNYKRLFKFGKYKGQQYDKVKSSDPNYIRWLKDQTGGLYERILN